MEATEKEEVVANSGVAAIWEEVTVADVAVAVTAGPGKPSFSSSTLPSTSGTSAEESSVEELDSGEVVSAEEGAVGRKGLVNAANIEVSTSVTASPRMKVAASCSRTVAAAIAFMANSTD